MNLVNGFWYYMEMRKEETIDRRWEHVYITENSLRKDSGKIYVVTSRFGIILSLLGSLSNDDDDTEDDAW